jgi:ABC-type sugar transport system ATPase subunit
MTVAQGPAGAFDTHSLVEAMVGRAGAWQAHARPAAWAGPHGDGPPALQVRGISLPGAVHDVDIELARGEIVGIAGLVGSGRSELLEGVFAVRQPTAGTVSIGGAPVVLRNPREAIDAGLGFLPPDRKTQGLVLGRTVDENLTMVATMKRPRFLPPGGRELQQRTRELSATLRLRAPSGRTLVSTLSGGNQQKVAVGKWLMADPRVLLLDEPTRGVDVAAKAEIHELLRRVSKTGVGMLVVSSETEELVGLCDRIDVMFRGRIVASMAAHEADESTIARYAGGHR